MTLKQILTSQTVIIGILLFISLSIRLYSIRDNQVYFWFDQSRDAIESRKIINDKDLKIQGPSASGTNDTVYHGVLYYYIIGHVYSYFQNPLIVSAFIAALCSVGIIGLFKLIEDITSSPYLASIGSLLYIFSFESIELSTWLSNPVIGFAVIPFYYLSLWKVFYRHRLNWIIALSISLGILLQSSVWSIYFVMPVLLAYLYLLFRNKDQAMQLFTLKNNILFLLPLLAIVSPMLLTQAKLYFAGIFSFEEFSSAAKSDSSYNFALLKDLVAMVLNKIANSIFPQLPLLSLVIVLSTFYVIAKRARSEVVLFLTTILTAPFWLLAIQPRDTYYTLFGLGMVIYIAFVISLTFLKKSWRIILSAAFLAIFAASNIIQLNAYRKDNLHSFAIQADTMLRDQLELLDKTYELANGQPFTISSFTNPYLYNTTWSFLYGWYGKNNYGYTPKFVGSDQSGIYGGELLEAAGNTGAIHFSIIEPSAGIADVFLTDFISSQEELSGQAKDSFVFGGITLVYRDNSEPED